MASVSKEQSWQIVPNEILQCESVCNPGLHVKPAVVAMCLLYSHYQPFKFQVLCKWSTCCHQFRSLSNHPIIADGLSLLTLINSHLTTAGTSATCPLNNHRTVIGIKSYTSCSSQTINSPSFLIKGNSHNPDLQQWVHFLIQLKTVVVLKIRFP